MSQNVMFVVLCDVVIVCFRRVLHKKDDRKGNGHFLGKGAFEGLLF
jgi:hypothetical protein